MNLPVYNGNIFFKLYGSESHANLKKNQLRSCDENTTWWRSTFWANYRGEWEWSIVQESHLSCVLDAAISRDFRVLINYS